MIGEPYEARIHTEAWRAYCTICPAGYRMRKTWLAFLAGWLAKADQQLARSRIAQYVCEPYEPGAATPMIQFSWPIT